MTQSGLLSNFRGNLSCQHLQCSHVTSLSSAAIAMAPDRPRHRSPTRDLPAGTSAYVKPEHTTHPTHAPPSRSLLRSPRTSMYPVVGLPYFFDQTSALRLCWPWQWTAPAVTPQLQQKTANWGGSGTNAHACVFPPPRRPSPPPPPLFRCKVGGPGEHYIERSGTSALTGLTPAVTDAVMQSEPHRAYADMHGPPPTSSSAAAVAAVAAPPSPHHGPHTRTHPHHNQQQPPVSVPPSTAAATRVAAQHAATSPTPHPPRHQTQHSGAVSVIGVMRNFQCMSLSQHLVPQGRRGSLWIGRCLPTPCASVCRGLSCQLTLPSPTTTAVSARPISSTSSVFQA